jgi:outer membrane protein OmpA-like peptidoglycan-associated protein
MLRLWAACGSEKNSGVVEAGRAENRRVEVKVLVNKGIVR